MAVAASFVIAFIGTILTLPLISALTVLFTLKYEQRWRVPYGESEPSQTITAVILPHPRKPILDTPLNCSSSFICHELIQINVINTDERWRAIKTQIRLCSYRGNRWIRWYHISAILWKRAVRQKMCASWVVQWTSKDVINNNCHA